MSRLILLQHAVQQLLVDRLGAEELRDDEGHHGRNGQGQQLLIGCRHFHNQHRARNGRTHGGGKESRHGDNHDISGIHSFDEPQAYQNIGTNAASKGADNQHG